jgi:8-oxo-dGTP diphosphatase
MGKADTVFLVRHAKAGERRCWNGDDTLRPLSNAGWRQAHAIATRLAKHGATTPISSPYVRCHQTLEPLGTQLGVEVTDDIRLIEGEPFEPVLELLAEAPTGAVLCSHGDIVPAVVQALERRGMEVQTPADWRKATVWVLHRKSDRVVRGRVWPPPQ